MPVTRRTFLKSCAMGAAALGVSELPPALNVTPGRVLAAVPEGGSPDSAFRPLTSLALETAQKLGASYADIRVARYREQSASLRTQAEFGTSKIQHVPSVSDSESFGFGIRVLIKDTWGFAASHKVERSEVARVAREAVNVAKTNSALRREPVQLAPVKSATDFYRTPFANSSAE